MKKFRLLFISFLMFPLLFGCNEKKANVTTSGKFCTFENKTSAPLNKDFSISVTPNSGYTLSYDCFTVKVNNEDITSKTACWSFNNNSLSIGAFYVVGDIVITGTAKKIASEYKVTVENKSPAYIASYGGDFPSVCYSNEDLIVKFTVNNDNYGVIPTVSINNIENKNYELLSNNDYAYLKINSEDLVGEVKITLEAVEGKISVSNNIANILNYDTKTIFVHSPKGGNLSIIGSSDAFTYTLNDNQIVIDSNSDNIDSDVTLTVSSDAAGSVSTNIKVSVYHPKNIEEALDAVTLGFIRGNTNFNVTFDYDNSESFSSFTDHLEITENMYYSYSSYTGLTSTAYYTGKGKTNNFQIVGLSAHGRNFAYGSSPSTTKKYPPINSANTVISKSECDGKTSTLKLLESSKTIKVYNSEELFWAVEHGYIPTFDSTATNAKSIYEKACSIVKEYTYDSMSVYEECLSLFNYLENNITYDYGAAESSTGYPAWLEYPAYFLEGVFLKDGLAVCDGFSKAYALLCGIDCLPVIRSFGYDDNSGHAWNYAKFDDNWYLICPTWAKENFNDTSFYSNAFSCYQYESFAKSKDYFYEASGHSYNFSDLAFPLIARSSKDYEYKALELGTFMLDGTQHNFIIKSNDDSLAVMNKCKSLSLGGTKFWILLDFSYFTDKTSVKNCLLYGIKNSSISYNSCSFSYNSTFSFVFVFFK